MTPVSKLWLRHWAKIIFALGTVAFTPKVIHGKPLDRNSRPISLDNKNLTRLRDSSMSHGIQKGFCTAIKAPQNCPECVDNFMGARIHRDVLKKPFLLVDSDENDFGGYFMLAVFKAHRKVYRLWIYRLSSGEFQLREMTPFITLNKALMEELSHRDYSPYWLNSCTSQ